MQFTNKTCTRFIYSDASLVENDFSKFYVFHLVELIFVLVNKQPMLYYLDVLQFNCS